MLFCWLKKNTIPSTLEFEKVLKGVGLLILRIVRPLLFKGRTKNGNQCMYQ